MEESIQIAQKPSNRTTIVGPGTAITQYITDRN